MRMFRKQLGLLLTGCLCFAAVAGCTTTGKPAGSNASSNSPAHSPTPSISDTAGTGGDYVDVQKKKWYIGDNISFDWYVNLNAKFTKWDGYDYFRDITKITGVKPNVTFPTGTPSEKLNLMLATGELPDMITLEQTDPTVEKLIKEGLVYSHDELIEKYAPEFKKEIPPDVYKFIRSDVDGKLYGLPSYYYNDIMGAYAYMVRQDIYEKLGSPDMSTPDNLAKALKLFKEKYPTMEGQPSIPMAFAIPGEDQLTTNVLEGSFGIRQYYTDDKGNVFSKYKNPMYGEYVKYMNRLFREGLIDKEMFIKKNEQLQKDYATRVFMVPGRYWDTTTATISLRKQFGEEQTYFDAMEPMKAVPAIDYPAENRMGWTITLITKKAKNPEALIKFIRYMWNSDGNLLMNYGKEGVDYKLEGNNSILRTLPKEKVVEYQTQTGILQLSFFKYNWLKEVLPDTPEMKKQLKMRALIDKTAKDWTTITYKMDPDPTSPEGVIATRIKEMAKTAMPRIILADSEEKALSTFNEMISNMEKAGMKQLETYYTNRYKKNVEKFGAEYVLK